VRFLNDYAAHQDALRDYAHRRNEEYKPAGVVRII